MMLKFLVRKYEAIRKALAENYVSENRGVIIEAKKKGSGKVIKQETKG